MMKDEMLGTLRFGIVLLNRSSVDDCLPNELQIANLKELSYYSRILLLVNIFQISEPNWILNATSSAVKTGKLESRE
jgi:hypothetical protein